MSVQTQINRIVENITAAFTAVGNKGGTVPEYKVSGNLTVAIESIPTGTPETWTFTMEDDSTVDKVVLVSD